MIFEILAVIAFLALFGLMIAGGVYVSKDMKHNHSKR